MQAALVMFKADGTRRDFPLSKPRTVIGRTVSCDLRIPLASVSRQHCELLLEGEDLRLRDLGSSNGTYHNAERVQEVVLTAGDEVIVGPVVFTVVINGRPEEIEPVRTVVEKGGREATVESKPGPAAGAAVATATDAESTGDPLQSEQPSSDEAYSPTVELDDPIAALENMGGEEQDPFTPDDDEPLLLDEDLDDDNR